MIFIPGLLERIPSCDPVELMENPKVRKNTYKIKESFHIPHFNTYANCEDVIYTNVGDNNFYIEKKMSGITYHCQVEWSLAMKALRSGLMELVKVEKAE